MCQVVLSPQAPTEVYANRRWAGWLFVLSIGGIMLAKFMGLIPETPTTATSLVTPPAVESHTTPMPEASPIQSVALLTACGQPDQVGTFLPGDTVCQPTKVWTLADFAQQLVPLNILADGEVLIAPPFPADSSCPLTIVRGATASGARLCFTPSGGVYREIGGTHDQEWNWRLNLAGAWTLDRPVLVAEASN